MGEALFLMVVGMVMVFIILLLVVVLGNVIIRFVNRFVPEEEVKAKTNQVAPTIDPKIYAAICSAVSTVTAGKGSVVEVKKI
ncbi:MAG: OadG family protein [Bacteroidales bacterium]|nr:OadG family protein [Bacteroidales bacterium]